MSPISKSTLLISLGKVFARSSFKSISNLANLRCLLPIRNRRVPSVVITHLSVSFSCRSIVDFLLSLPLNPQTRVHKRLHIGCCLDLSSHGTRLPSSDPHAWQFLIFHKVFGDSPMTGLVSILLHELCAVSLYQLRRWLTYDLAAALDCYIDVKANNPNSG